MNDWSLSPGTLAALVCSLEVAAPKPGNVHRGADFENLKLEDFLVSAHLLGQAIDQNRDASLGITVFDAVAQTRRWVGSNTNLGIALLLVPLAKAIYVAGIAPQLATSLDTTSVQSVLANLTLEDATFVYQAIRLANPGGLCTVEQGDLNDPLSPVLPLLEAMALAADRDLIARQYHNGFRDVFATGVDLLVQGSGRFSQLSQAIVYAHVGLMAEFPDSLIARKCGILEAQRSQTLAREAFDCLNEKQFEEPMNLSRLSELDFWLRAKGNQRNPGTSADLVAASLFVAIYNRQIQPPFR